MRGDVPALRRVFTERGLHGGDNESWSFTAWPLLHVVGAKRFAAFLRAVGYAVWEIHPVMKMEVIP